MPDPIEPVALGVFRDLRGMSIPDLAIACTVARATIYDWEARRRMMDAAALKKVGDALGLTHRERACLGEWAAIRPSEGAPAAGGGA
jgi:transcriptional regulator with XRE-family HTH domain